MSHVIDPVTAGDSGRTRPGPSSQPREYGELVMCDALTLSGLIKSRQVSCADVMTAYLDHIELHNRSVNAIVALRDRDELLTEARERDRQLAAGRYLGWMHGFPHAVKDLSAVEGLPFTSGSPIFADRIADADELFVTRIKSAGAIIIGKTNTPEFGLGSQTYNPVWGTTATPYDTSRTAG
ncbi:MAG: amidase, partial [Rhodococcus sp. (in: high G+C Gram-positive bacteria)]